MRLHAAAGVAGMKHGRVEFLCVECESNHFTFAASLTHIHLTCAKCGAALPPMSHKYFSGTILPEMLKHVRLYDGEYRTETSLVPNLLRGFSGRILPGKDDPE